MEIRPVSQLEGRRIDVSEWNADAEAYFKPFAGPESLVFNDLYLEYRDKASTSDARFAAAFKAAKLALVDKSGAPLPTDADFDAAYTEEEVFALFGADFV